MVNTETDNIGHTRHMTSKRQRKPKGQSRMVNTETQTTLDIQDTEQSVVNKCQRKPNGQSGMDNTETQATFWTHKTHDK